MKEATPAAGKLAVPTLNKTGVNNNKGPKQTTAQEMECTPANQEESPPKKKKPPSKPSTDLESADSFEATAAGASREVSMLLSKFSKVLSERAAADSSQMRELEGILAEAKSLESYLKEKKTHLRQTLAVISDKLLG
ncbi:Testis-expressed protein 12 [Larimichthys crocea]|uniref:Uncharacterized protein n=1 Tax=Larimichthys crocea TaxID=215358 RepID=A0ACD3QJV9_LARCR|nr:Testis-expressed protein 12 [Larimichthys crocea]